MTRHHKDAISTTKTGCHKDIIIATKKKFHEDIIITKKMKHHEDIIAATKTVASNWVITLSRHKSKTTQRAHMLI